MARTRGPRRRGPARKRRRGRSPAWWALALALLVAAAFVLYRTRPPGGGPAPGPERPPAGEERGASEGRDPAEGRAGEAHAPSREGAPPAAAEEELPPLEASDAFVRERAEALSDHPAYRRWLAGVEGLVRRSVATVENLAAGASPARHWRGLAPERPFTVRERPDGTVVPAPESYARYDAHAEAFASLDVEATVRLYRRLRPLLREAYRGLGHPEGGLDAALREAVAELRDTPRLERPPALVARGGRWEYRDPELEALSPAQKQLLRMGPENAARVRAKLDAFAEALGLDEASGR